MRIAPVLTLLVLATVALTAHAGQVTVGSGSSLDLGSGSVDLGCADLTVEGTLSAGTIGFTQARDVTITAPGVVNGESATLQVAGDWDNAGAFNAGTSTVRITDGCSLLSGVVAGDTTFENLTIDTTSSRLVSFEAGATTTVNGDLDLSGQTGALLQIRSTAGGSAAFLNLQGGSDVAFVDVQDNDATAGNAIPLDSTSVKGSNTPGWTLVAAIPVLAPTGLLAAVLGLLWGGRRRLRTSR